MSKHILVCWSIWDAFFIVVVVSLETDINWRAITLIWRTFHSWQINPTIFVIYSTYRFNAIVCCSFSFPYILIYVSFARSSAVHNLQCFANAKVCGGVCFAIEKQAARINPVENFSLAKIVCAVWPMLMRMRSLLNMRQFKSVSFESHNKFAKPNHTNPKANSK